MIERCLFTRCEYNDRTCSEISTGLHGHVHPLGLCIRFAYCNMVDLAGVGVPLCFLGFFRNFLKLGLFIFRVCNYPNVHVLWVWSKVAFSPNFFRPPLSEFSGSTLV